MRTALSATAPARTETNLAHTARSFDYRMRPWMQRDRHLQIEKAVVRQPTLLPRAGKDVRFKE